MYICIAPSKIVFVSASFGLIDWKLFVLCFVLMSDISSPSLYARKNKRVVSTFNSVRGRPNNHIIGMDMNLMYEYKGGNLED